MIPAKTGREPHRTSPAGSLKGTVPLTIVLRTHTIECAMAHSDHRVLDILNDLSSGFLKVSNVNLHGVTGFGGLGPLDEAVIPKTAIDCVLLDQDSHEAPIRRRHALVAKHQRSALVLLPNHELCGMTNWAGRSEPLALLSSDAASFFPVSTATLWNVNRHSDPISASVAFVNKASVSMLSLGDRCLL